MVQYIRWRGEAEPVTWRDGPAAFAGVSFRGGTDDAGPAADDERGLVAVLDGRIDDRDELAAALRQRVDIPHRPGDPDLLIPAFEQWGIDLPGRFTGDFALAVWDARRRSLFLARDAFGIRPLFHGQHDGAFAFASDPRAVLAGLGLPWEPNEGVLGEILSLHHVSVEETLYRGVSRLPPASSLLLEGDVAETRDWWDPGAIEAGSTGSGEDVDELLEITRTAVRRRTRGLSRVACFLSGGVDSALVTALAREQGMEVTTSTGTFPGHAFDEGQDARRLAGDLGTRHIETPYRECGLSEFTDQVERFGLLPMSPPGTGGLDLYRDLERDEQSVVLTGYGGDEWATGHPARVADLLRRGRWGRAAVLARRWSGRGSRLWPSLRSHGLVHLLPESVVAMRRAATGRLAPSGFLHADFVRRTDLRRRLRGQSRPIPGHDAESNALLRCVRTGWWQETYEANDRAAVERRIDMRHPLMDRRWVEFVLGLPWERRSDGVRTKIALREAAARVLPPGREPRDDKPHSTPLFVDDTKRLVSQKPPWKGPLVDRGILNPDLLRDAAASLDSEERGVPGFYPRVWRVFETFAASLWLDTLPPAIEESDHHD
jgi:asparagine synthase (glutamine-hydrolysing)